MKAFEVKVNGKILDYRLGKQLDLDKIGPLLNKARAFFEKKYKVLKLWSGGRHMLGILGKDKRQLFLKLATTEGISTVTKIEYRWNEEFNQLVSRKSSNFWIPKNIDYGIYNNTLFYLITDKFDGELLVEKPQRVEISRSFLNTLPFIIEFSELIQNLEFPNLFEENSYYKKIFLEKTKAWYMDIPEDIREKYELDDLLKIVKSEVSGLQKRPRHGDFTPWHLIKLRTGQLGLIDGEHAKTDGVEYYDIGYFIQRVFSVLENPEFAKRILSLILKRNYSLEKIRVILAARGIGGFLDKSLEDLPDYTFSNKFKDWVLSIT